MRTQAQVADSFSPTIRNLNTFTIVRDGKILVAGSIAGPENVLEPLVRLDPAGIIDPRFDSSLLNTPGASSLAVLPDDTILVPGAIPGSLGQLRMDGSLTFFNPGELGNINAMALQRDGKIIIAADGISVDGQVRKLARIYADGSLDTTFHPELGGLVASVHCVALQPDGRILIGGSFHVVASQGRTNLARLNPEGTLDLTFPGLIDEGSGYGDVMCLGVQADNKILVGGRFTRVSGQSRTNIARINPDGTLDGQFNPGADGYLYAVIASLLPQADGKILVGGGLDTLAGQARTGVGRLNPDGSLDTSFADPQSGWMSSMALQLDGKILVGGDNFYGLGGQPRFHMGRLINTGPATQKLTFDGSTVTWMRGGTSPEVWRTTFEYSQDAGGSWTKLGDGIRIAGGWELPGATVPTESWIRTRGYTVGGHNNGSFWFVETTLSPPFIVTEAANRTNDVGTTAEFYVYVSGGDSLSYRWRKNGVDLADGGNVAGAHTSDLVLTNVFGADAAEYSVVISSSAGTNISRAWLTVIDPLITSQPLDQVGQLGGAVTFSVQASGTQPFAYQWRKNGFAISGATQSSLTITNLELSDDGDYDVIVRNAWGMQTSAAAELTVNLAVIDDGFAPQVTSPGVAGGAQMFILAVQPDGRILAGGQFSTINGNPKIEIARFNPDGTSDASFKATSSDLGYISVYNEAGALALQPDGKIVAGGLFSTLGGQRRTNLGRLNSDGTLDVGFSTPGWSNLWGSVNSLVVQPDGKIVVGGNFIDYLGHTNVLRLNPDGTPDTTFQPPAFPLPSWATAPYVVTMALQPDGKVLVGGHINGCVSNCDDLIFLSRLNPDGTLDTSFLPSLYLTFDFGGFLRRETGNVQAVAVLPDGQILAAGRFYSFMGQPHVCVVRLKGDGTVDPSFNPGVGGSVSSLAVQADGQIILGGQFSAVQGQSRDGLVRLNPDGTLDPTFAPVGNFYSLPFNDLCLTLQPDGKLLVGGSFTRLNGESRTSFGRLSNTKPATQSLSFDGATLTWLRGGASPEVWRTHFDYSLDGSAWMPLGEGMRMDGGWQLSGISLPLRTIFRARGDVTAASWYVETTLSPVPAIANITRSPGDTFRFEALAPSGSTVVVEASLDLRTWTAIGTNVLGSTPLDFSDPQSALSPARFYRLRLVR